MVVNMTNLRAQMDRTASVAHDVRYADAVRIDLVKVVQGLLEAVVELQHDVDELKRIAK
jgi:hypothetical protein